jgi:DinB superfamily
MDAIEFFRVRYSEFHRSLWDDLTAGLAEHELRGRPHPNANTIAWLIWHIARIEDVGINRFVVDGRQVLDTGAWLERMRLRRRDVGTGMTDVDVDELSAAISLDGLRGYWEAVIGGTVAVVEDLRGAALDTIVPPDRVRRVSGEEGAVGANANWLTEFWAKGRTRAWMLAQTALLHVYGHYFEARAVKGLWGHPSP